MPTLTLGQSRQQIARVIGVCDDSPQVAERLNEAQSRLLNRSEKPVGSFLVFQTCAGRSDCVVWARQIRSIEAYAICGQPGVTRSAWWEFIGWPNGMGRLNGQSMCGSTLVDRGTTCAFDEVHSTVAVPKKISIVASNAADAGKTVTLRYIDSSGQRVYSSIGGVAQEGEELTLATPPAVVYTSQNVATNGLYMVIKAVTDYPIYLYEVDAGTLAITKMLAEYAPSETTPNYRKSFIPGLRGGNGCCSDETDDECTDRKSLTVLCRLQHVPVVVDNDPLVIGNIAALKLMVMAILREEENRLEESAVYEAKANREIDGEMSAYLGDGMVSTLKVEGAEMFGAGLSSENYRWWGTGYAN